jgi:hypothetical protein
MHLLTEADGENSKENHLQGAPNDEALADICISGASATVAERSEKGRQKSYK